jgi:hypothetical protein
MRVGVPLTAAASEGIVPAPPPAPAVLAADAPCAVVSLNVALGILVPHPAMEPNLASPMRTRLRRATEPVVPAVSDWRVPSPRGLCDRPGRDHVIACRATRAAAERETRRACTAAGCPLAPAAQAHLSRRPGQAGAPLASLRLSAGRPHEPAQLAFARVETGSARGRDRARTPDLRPAPHVRDLEPRRRRVAVLAGPPHGDVGGDDRRTYGHLAPDAESHERELLDAFDAKNDAFGQLSGTDTS